ncbi:unnamed protein product [Scytosiphon promiscuus]
MKLACSLALIATLLAGPANAVEYTVQTCADLADVDDTLATLLTIDSSTFACDEYTRFRVRNTMTLKATGASVEFSNFSLKVLGGLTVEPDVTFTGVVEQVKNGGVLSVVDGATATFMGTAEFIDNSVLIKQIGPISCGDYCTRIGRGLSYIVKKGGAVHNKGTLTFEGDTTFTGNQVQSEDEAEQGMGGAISNTGSGSIFFKGKLTMEDNRAKGTFGGRGGSIYTRGKIIIDGDSYFSLGRATDGGAIYQTQIGSLVFNGMATFYQNVAYSLRGGGVYNGGGIVDFDGGSVFESNAASSTGDGGYGGGIYNGDEGVVTLRGSNTFRSNMAFRGGAIYTEDGDVEDGEAASTTTFPADTAFLDNSAEICPDVYTGDDDNCPVV